jgi:hypothetical protein
MATCAPSPKVRRGAMIVFTGTTAGERDLFVMALASPVGGRWGQIRAAPISSAEPAPAHGSPAWTGRGYLDCAGVVDGARRLAAPGTAEPAPVSPAGRVRR